MNVKERDLINVSQNFKVLATGVFGLLLLSFSSLKLSVIYASNPFLSYLVTYNISGLVFLFYFYAYLKSKFNFKIWVLIFAVFNIGIHVFDFIYNQLILINNTEIHFDFIIIYVVINFLTMILAYFILRGILKFKKT
ncbi:MAG: hypothetical protein K9J13_16540 [Saprospiraceae bacterium]|nr:hypothetical protein [Saprospiraceae bacterium]